MRGPAIHVSLDTILLILAVVTMLGHAGWCLDFVLGQRRMRRLRDIAPAGGGPSLSVIVAARNEARGIEPAVLSLLHLDYAPLEIVVVDDRSTDGTGAILDRLSLQHDHLRILHVSELPEGWLGKNYALAMGAADASGQLLLFTDADIVFEPTTLRRAVALIEEERLDHLAALPDVRVPGIALSAFVAAFGVFFSMYARPWKVGDPRSPRHIGVGAFNLIRAGVYRAIGTHRAIAMRPDDDMKLGKLVKKNGFRQGVVYARELITVEWYASLGELIDGLMKNAFAGVEYSLLAVIGSTVVLFLTEIWPWLALFATHGATRMLNAVSVLLIAATFWACSRASGTRFVYVLAFPAATLLFVYIVWRSALLAVIRGAVVWRGTAYPLSQLRANRI